MSLRFYFGPSDTRKSEKLYQDIIARAMENPKQNYLVIVPDQFTMQTQKDLVTMHECGGIMNIDVLSFGRLSHRILEEVGYEEVPVLDDTGKSLVLQKVTGAIKDDLPTLGSNLHRQGYIHEVKSAISEFMQYGIKTEDVTKLIDYVNEDGKGRRNALSLKLKDLEKIYKAFMDYIHDKFITAEETLDVLKRSLQESKVIKGSVIVFDGFTGFTPIQNRVLQELMRLGEEVILSLTMGEKEDPFSLDGEQKLFYLSKKTVADMEKLAKEIGVKRGRDVFVSKEEDGQQPGQNQIKKSALNHLQDNLFRYPFETFSGEQKQIAIFACTNPKEEVHQSALKIRQLIREEGLEYRDIAVVTGNLEEYAPYVETEFMKMNIPCYVDRTRGILLNPMTEYIKSVLNMFLQDFSYESVFHFLRCGMTDIERSGIDLFENYIIKTGIKGYRKYSRLFTHKTEQMKDNEEALAEMNATREKMLQCINMLCIEKKAKAKDYVEGMYEFLVQNKVQEKLETFRQMFEEKGDSAKAKEYAQIYRLVMDLFNQIYQLLGEEEISLQEFADILEAGFGEIEVGTIPQNVDRIVVGDIERTRLKNVKVLFFMGVVDGNIPRNTSKGGIISDMDREFLKDSSMELAPTPRQQMFIQRFYLYLNMTKPTKRLFLSFAKMDSTGSSTRPAYLIDTLKKLFSDITIEFPEERGVLHQMETPVEGMDYLAEQLRGYVLGMPVEKEKEFFSIYHAYGSDEVYGEQSLQEIRNQMTNAAFTRYQNSPLSKLVAQTLYGKNLENSVTRLETYASCAYKHFLQYGLSLKEREEFGFEAVDMGNIYHGVLQQFSDNLQTGEVTWFDFTEDYARQSVKEALDGLAAVYGESILYSNARNAYAITRMERILTRTVLTLQEHLKKGVFTPAHYELSFQYAKDLESVNLALSEDEKMHLKGRIDRIDTAEDNEHVYVKIIDYKSGERDFELAALYYGLQLQLVVYMKAATELIGKEYPGKEVVPAAMLYYHIDDPVIDEKKELNPEQLQQKLEEQMCMKGLVNGDLSVVEKLDRYLENKSTVIPVAKKKDGNFTSASSVMEQEKLKLLSDFVTHKMKTIGREILDGNIKVDPIATEAQKDSCTYCAFKKVCGFDPNISGYQKRKMVKDSDEEILERMAKDCGNNLYTGSTEGN